MRKHTLTALIVGVLAITALGVWWAPSFMHRDTEVTEPAASVVSPPAETAKPRRAPAPKATARKDVEKTTIAPDVVNKIRHALMAGAGGIGLVGTADQIAEKLKVLSDCGLDGILLSWIDYEEGMRSFTADVLPRLVQMGLRK